MCTKRLAGMVALLALVTLGVVGVDRWTKVAKARAEDPSSTGASRQPPTLVPVGRSTIHYQVDPSTLPLLPPVAPENQPPPLTSTGELEKKLKESLINLEKVLPTTPSLAESGPPPLEATKVDSDNFPSAPVPPPVADKILDRKDSSIPALPPVTNALAPAAEAVTPLPAPTAAPPLPTPPAPTAAPPSLPVVPAPSVAPPSLPAVPPPVPQGPSSIAAIPPPVPVESPPFDNNAKPVSPAVAPPAPMAPIIMDPSSLVKRPGEPETIRNVAVALQDDFQKRLTDLEIKYLKDSVAELDRRIQKLPATSAERRKLEMDHQRLADRLLRLMKSAELTLSRRNDDPLAKGDTDSPWIMNLETVEGKTVLQAIVHRKARFKIVCERLDLQSPRGTVLAVGNVLVSGEGFQGSCDRLSIPLHDDRLILEGNAEVGIRTQPMALIEGKKEGLPPLVESRRLDEQSPAGAVPILNLKGEHLDLRWSDLQPSAPGDARANDPDGPTIRATPGPMVKVSYSNSGAEKWSAWGTLKKSALEKDGRPLYVIEDGLYKPLVYVHTPPGMSLADYVGKRVSVFGRPVREEGRTTPTFTASHVAWE